MPFSSLFSSKQENDQRGLTTSAPGPWQPLASSPLQQGGGSGSSDVYRAVKLLLQSEDGSFAWEDTGVRLD